MNDKTCCDKPIPEFAGYCYNHASYYCGCPLRDGDDR